MHRDRIHLQVKAAEVSFKETGEHHVSRHVHRGKQDSMH